MITAQEALQRLREGNQRYIDESKDHDVELHSSRRTELVAGQRPIAIILGCSDSRAPAELVFDQGLGDLFVIRVAGNIVAPSQIGSVEFAASEFGTPLVVVMGHTRCGAVQATVDQQKQPASERSPNLESIVKRIQPALQSLIDLDLPDEELVRRAIYSNVRSSVGHLRAGSDIIESLVASGKLLIVGAVYNIETGGIDFFEGLPE